MPAGTLQGPLRTTSAHDHWSISANASSFSTETDMNRCFLATDLLDQSLDTIEVDLVGTSTQRARARPCARARETMEAWQRVPQALRAKEIDRELGPKNSASPKADFIIDLHNTTSDTGAPTMQHAACVAQHATYDMQHVSTMYATSWRPAQVPKEAGYAYSSVAVTHLSAFGNSRKALPCFAAVREGMPFVLIGRYIRPRVIVPDDGSSTRHQQHRISQWQQ